NLENSIKAAQGSGHLLSDDVREPMEQAFNKDFSEVRVHTDSEADALNKQLSARAFTTGQDVFFREGEYSPGSDSGRELIAHELTHTVQQTGGKKPQRHPVEEETQMKLDTPRSIIEGGHVNQEMESDLQQARGNTQSPDGSVQRMAIIVADDMNDETDTLVWNNLENAKREAGGPVGDLSAHKVWDQLGKNEAIRLVGHGKEDKPEIVPDIKTTDIVKSMTEGTETLDTPDNVKIKEVTFQSCYAGIGPVNTMVGEMKDLLEGKGYHGVTVKGRTGVAFGFKGMGEKTGETTKGGTYIKDPGALNFYTVNYPDILNEDKGTQVYCEAMYLCRNYKTKTTNVDIFKTPFEPCGYNDPWYIIKISEPEWDTWTASKRSKFVAREMEPYWKEVKRIMKGGGGFKAKGEILTKKTYVKRLAGVLDKIAKKFGIY
ncbi:MAG: DUF4157 domain-containing protein, partial [Dehalococcoidia bacterium]